MFSWGNREWLFKQCCHASQCQNYILFVSFWRKLNKILICRISGIWFITITTLECLLHLGSVYFWPTKVDAWKALKKASGSPEKGDFVPRFWQTLFDESDSQANWTECLSDGMVWIVREFNLVFPDIPPTKKLCPLGWSWRLVVKFLTLSCLYRFHLAFKQRMTSLFCNRARNQPCSGNQDGRISDDICLA